MSRTVSVKSIYFLGAATALIAALLFRRNIGAEISLFITEPAPASAMQWFTLLQNNSLLGIGLLNIFDSINYILIGVMFVALYFALRQTSRSMATSATILGLAGIAVYLTLNTAYTMLSLGSQYATAVTDAQRTTLLVAGQAIIANGAPGAVYEGLGGYVSLFLIAIAGALVCVAMLKSRTFNKAIAYVGLVACTLDLVYLIGITFIPSTEVPMFSAACLSTGGLLLFVWHLFIGLKLYKLSRTNKPEEV